MRSRGGLLGVALLLIQSGLIVRAPNPEIADNELGITSRACAASYCTSKDSLDLWLALEWDCHQNDKVVGDGQGPPDTTETIIQAPSRRKRRRRLSAETSSTPALSVTRVMTAIASSVLGVVGVLTGYRVGRMMTMQEKVKARVISSKMTSSASAVTENEDESGTPSKRTRGGKSFKAVSSSSQWSYGAIGDEERDESESQLLFSHSARNLAGLFPNS
jgi:hypothetical protein